MKDNRLSCEPLCLTIAGSDSSGGAGLQTDLAAFRALRCAGASVVTCVTAQSHDELRSVTPMDSVCVRDQLECVLEQMPVVAIKTGALATASVVHVVADVLMRYPDIPLVIDPVLLSTTGKPLIDAAGEEALIERLIPRATILTPNLPEAAQLMGDASGAQPAAEYAQALWSRYGIPVLVKGGHEPQSQCAGSDGSQPLVFDWFCDGSPCALESVRIPVGNVRGTGCALASAIAAGLAHGLGLPDAVKQAHATTHRWIARATPCGFHSLLDFA